MTASAAVPNVVPDGFVSGLEGVVAFTTDIAEPDKDGGALRYRGVDIEDLVGNPAAGSRTTRGGSARAAGGRSTGGSGA
ncbi:citrate/2-methylcitrate synthase, partial [Nocardia sp. NPDC050789]|uniref:citrate/2-methylcitrate synthase n=1 Tax=Nocardia sp. NPDC050789 TaxID=3154841 RepID=UPI0033C8325A